MDPNALSLLTIMVVLVAACIAVYLGFYNAMRRAGAESRRRLIARCAVLNWAAMAALVPVMMLSALGALPRWVCANAIIIACVISVVAARSVRRSTMRTHGFV